MAVLEESADGGVALEADRDVVGVAGFGVRAGLGQQLRARGPVGLVLGEPRIGGDLVERRERRAARRRTSASARARLMATTGEPDSASSAS